MSFIAPMGTFVPSVSSTKRSISSIRLTIPVTDLKSAPKKVIFFNKKELEKLEKFEIPESKLYLIRVRDVFLFQCYT